MLAWKNLRSVLPPQKNRLVCLFITLLTGFSFCLSTSRLLPFPSVSVRSVYLVWVPRCCLVKRDSSWRRKYLRCVCIKRQSDKSWTLKLGCCWQCFWSPMLALSDHTTDMPALWGSFCPLQDVNRLKPCCLQRPGLGVVAVSNIAVLFWNPVS